MKRFGSILVGTLLRGSGVRSRRCTSVASALDFRDIPSPKGLPLVGTAPFLLTEGGASRLHLYVDKRHRNLGPIFRDTIGPVQAVFLSDMDLMRSVFAQEGKYPLHILPEAWTLYNKLYECNRGLLFMDGEEWLHHRRILNRHLLKGQVQWIESACNVVSEDLVQKWLNFPNGTLVENLDEELYRWSLNTVVAVLLGEASYQTYKTSLKPLMKKLASTVHLIFYTTMAFQILPARIAHKFNLPSWKKFVNSMKTALELSNQLVDQILKLPGDGLLHRLKEDMPDALHRMVIDLILAAGDTTAYTMAWALYSVGKDREVQSRLQKGSVKNAIKETLRLYPVAPFITRILPSAAIVGGYAVPQGTPMIFSCYTSWRDSIFFENPETFNPDRWEREKSVYNVQQSCIPFGFGARSCIGKKIAEAQLQALLGGVVENFDLQIENKNVELVLKMVAVPSETIQLRLFKK